MAIHLTPDELSDALGLESREIVRMCQEEAVPILHGKIDKTLFVYSMKASGRVLPDDAEVLLHMTG
jgi:hypothetical protein